MKMLLQRRTDKGVEEAGQSNKRSQRKSQREVLKYKLYLRVVLTYDKVAGLSYSPAGSHELRTQMGGVIVCGGDVIQSLSHMQLFATPWTVAHQGPLSCTPRVCSNPCPLSQWCYLTISFSAATFSCCLQSFPASESFPISQFFSSGDQSTGVSALAAILPMNIQGWFPLGLTSLISLLSKGLSRVFSSNTIWKHQLSDNQPSLWTNFHIHT